MKTGTEDHLEKFTQFIRDTIHEGEDEKKRLLYEVRDCRNVNTNLLNKLQKEREKNQRFDGLTIAEYELLARIADLQDELAECRARID